ncbi:hypothetical protein ACLOJK_000482 [Asimina triloba]
MKDPTTLSDQVLSWVLWTISCQPLPPSLDIHHQEGKQLAGYSQHTVRQDHQQPQQELSSEIPQFELRHGHAAPVGSHVNSSSSMEPQKISGGEFRMVSTKDTQVVQSLVEGCLQRYMNKKEVVEDLLRREKVEPSYTQIGNPYLKSTMFLSSGLVGEARGKPSRLPVAEPGGVHILGCPECIAGCAQKKASFIVTPSCALWTARDVNTTSPGHW